MRQVLILSILCGLLGCNPSESQKIDNLSVDDNRNIVAQTRQDKPEPINRIQDDNFPLTASILQTWIDEEPIHNNYVYLNHTKTLFDYMPEEQEKAAQFSLTPDEARVIGYWFGLDGLDTKKKTTFNETLANSNYPNLTFLANKMFLVRWWINGPTEKSNGNDIKDFEWLKQLVIRGKWGLVNNKIHLYCYQYSIYFEGEKPSYHTLTSPYEIALADINAISDDNYSSEKFNAISLPPEIQDLVPHQKLIFTQEGSYFIKSFFFWEADAFSNGFYKYSKLYSVIGNGEFTLDEILTSDENNPRALKEYWSF